MCLGCWGRGVIDVRFVGLGLISWFLGLANEERGVEEVLLGDSHKG